MASILKSGSLALALIILIFLSSSFHTITTATARVPYNHVRRLAGCDGAEQSDGPGCRSGGGSGDSAPAKPKPCGYAPGWSLCKKGCCGVTKMGKTKCCK